MIQEISPYHFDNSYRNEKATCNDKALSFKDGRVCVSYDEEKKQLIYPNCKEGKEYIYAFSIDEEKYFLHFMEEETDETLFSMRDLMGLDLKENKEAFAAYSAYHLYEWYRTSRYCGACGEKLIYGDEERVMICPKCGKVLNVVSESGRWTRGRPRFKYVCPGHRKKECDYLAVDGVKLDDQVVRQLAALVDEQKETYFKLIEARIRELTRSDASEREYQETKKDIEKIKADIAAQIRNLREADDVLRKFIQDDVTEMSAELSRKEAVLLKLEEERGDNSQTIEDLSQVKKKLADFKESWKTATPEELMSMVRAVVERVYVVYEDDEPIAHIFLKGCIKEDYTSFFDTAGYIPFTGNGVLKVNLCVIQRHENDAEEEIHTQMTQPDKYREHTWLKGRYRAQTLL